MLGKRTAPKLSNMGIKTIGDLAKTDQKLLLKKFGKHGSMMWNYANGIDNQEVNYKYEKPKSIGNSVTLPTDISGKEQLQEVILALTEQVTYRLRKNKLLANVVNVQLRTKDFVDFSHQKKLDFSTANTKDIYKKAKELLNEMHKQNILIRLVGVRVDNLIDKNQVQLSLFNNLDDGKQEKLDKVMDELKGRYGYGSITRMGEMDVNNIINIRKKE